MCARARVNSEYLKFKKYTLPQIYFRFKIILSRFKIRLWDLIIYFSLTWIIITSCYSS